MKRLISAPTHFFVAVTSLVLSVLAVIFAARNSAPNQPSFAASPFLEQIRTERVIRVGYALNPPQADRNPETGELSGYHIDVVREIARRAGAKIEFEEVTFSDMQLALQGRVQVVVGGGFVSVERAASFSFTEPLIFLGLGYICRADDARFKSEEDLQIAGIKVAVAAGSASEEYLKENLPQATPITLAKGELARVGLEVLSGRADAGIFNQAHCIRVTQEHRELKYPTRGKPFYRFQSSFTLRQGDPDALEFWNASIRTLRANGFFARLEQKYNPQGLFWTQNL